MIAPTQKPHLSATQIESVCRCGEAYRRRYIEGEIIPPGMAIIAGKSFHKGAQTNFSQKIESRRDLPPREIVEAAAAAFDTELAGGYLLTAEEEKRGAKAVLGEAKDRTVEMVSVHAAQQAPDYQPVLVEKLTRIELPHSSHDLLGIIDLADDRDRVVDFKTAGKSKSQADADDSTQLTVYAATFHAETGRPPALVQLDTIVKTKTKTSRNVVASSRGEADFQALANRINAVTAAINSGVFTPATPGAWWCAAKWCGYWHSCPYVNSERAALAEANAEA